MADEIPQWAYERAIELSGLKPLWTPALAADCQNGHLNAFARYIAKVAETAAAALRIEHHDNCTSPAGYPEQCACGVGGVRKPLQELLAPEPVDPLLIEARELAAADILIDARVNGIYSDEGNPFWGEEAVPVLLSGNADQSITVQSRLRALRRGMELGREQSK